MSNNAYAAPAVGETMAAELYLDLLKKCLTRSIFSDCYVSAEPRHPVKRLLYAPLRRAFAARNCALMRRIPFDPALRAEGRDWAAEAETMIGLRRLNSLQACVVDVLRQGVPGDLIETGVWRGGATIFMRGVLKAYGAVDRVVWAADSFEGLPKPDAERYPADAGDRHWQFARLAVSLEEVQGNFARYGLLDKQVRFLPGWFRDTLAAAPIEQLAILRMDGDMYESTMDALRNLYPKLAVGGYAIVDDYEAVAGCRKAVDDFRRQENITEEVEWIDWSGVYWQRRS